MGRSSLLQGQLIRGPQLRQLQLRQLLQAGEAKGPEKVRRGAVLQGPAGHIQPPALLNQLFIEQRRHGIGAVHSPDLLHHSLGGRLIIGNHRQSLQLGGGKLGGLPGLQGPGHKIPHFSGRAHLVGAVQPHHPDAPSFKAQAVHEAVRRLLHLPGFTAQGLAQALQFHRLPGGKQKQCNFKDERDVDALLELLAKQQPQIRLLSAAGEQALQKKAEEKAARKLPELSDDAKHTVTVLRRAKEYLDAKPELSNELSAAQRRKRAQLKSKPVYRYVALAIFLFGTAAAAYGLYAVFTHTGSYGVYFALFGFAAIFLFSSYNMLPTAHNNNSAIMKRADQADAAMAEYVKHYPNGSFPVPSCYAHPIVLKRMIDAVEEGQAVTTAEALDAVKARLQAVNADVQVEQEEYDEIVAIKALFLNHDYQ